VIAGYISSHRYDRGSISRPLPAFNRQDGLSRQILDAISPVEFIKNNCTCHRTDADLPYAERTTFQAALFYIQRSGCLQQMLYLADKMSRRQTVFALDGGRRGLTYQETRDKLTNGVAVKAYTVGACRPYQFREPDLS
jgi:hypothetical protein